MMNETIRRVNFFLSSANFQLNQISNTTVSTSEIKQNLYLDWSENPWSCNCAVISFVGWLITKGNWMKDVNGYRDVICYDTKDHGSIRRSVYIDGKLQKKTLSTLLNRCIVILMMSSSTMMPQSYDVTDLSVFQKSVNYNKFTTVTPKNLSKQSNFIDSPQHSASPHLAAIISILVIADVFVYVIIVLLIKKQTLCKGKKSSVAPYA